MPIPFYDASVKSYMQVLDGVAGVLENGVSHAAESRPGPAGNGNDADSTRT